MIYQKDKDVCPYLDNTIQSSTVFDCFKEENAVLEIHHEVPSNMKILEEKMDEILASLLNF